MGLCNLYEFNTKAARELERAIAAASKTKKFAKAAQARKTAKRATKKDETAAIREAVRERSGGGCELCPDLGTELHHALGRVRVKQSAGNCLWLCRSCHHAITTNRPSAEHWLEAQARKFSSLYLAGGSEALGATSDALWARKEFSEARAALSRQGGEAR